MSGRTPYAVTLLGALALAGTLSSCAVTGVGVGVDDEVGVGYAGGYYEPYGYEYGGWGRGYRVGPGRERDPHWGHPEGGRVGRTPAFRPASPGRPMPSLPGGHHGR